MLAKSGLLEPYAALALSSLHLGGSKEWAEKHQAEVEKYLGWIGPQREGTPALIMPVPPK